MSQTLAAAPAIAREIQVDSTSGRKPKIVARMRDWEYLERALHRLLAAWGRHLVEWDDKTAIHRHVWESAECVRRLRERLTQFPGSVNNLDAPVSPRLERLVNAVLQAPSYQDAVDGIYQILIGALARSYGNYAASAHPIHDAPTLALLGEIVTIKDGQRLWLRDFRRRYRHVTDANYRAAIAAELDNCGDLRAPLSLEAGEAAARLVGVGTDFRQAQIPARPAALAGEYGGGFMRYVSADFAGSVEARRLFWCYGYLLEMNLAVDQLRWIYDGHFMPWEFLQDISRHLWDESRHGDSGHSRLLDFGVALDGADFWPSPHQSQNASGKAAPMTPAQLYQDVFFIGMIAETGHFTVKREAYEDFKEGGDLESAEMMLFDIIDEGAHVQYAHRWLPLLAEKAGLDNADYRERAARERARAQENHLLQRAEFERLPRDADAPDYVYYQHLLQIMRERQPLSNAASCPARSPQPM